MCYVRRERIHKDCQCERAFVNLGDATNFDIFIVAVVPKLCAARSEL